MTRKAAKHLLEYSPLGMVSIQVFRNVIALD